MHIHIPDDLPIKVIDLESFPNRRADLEDKYFCQNIGDEWYESKESCILKVPSVIIPQEYNFIINTKHPDFQRVSIVNKEEFRFDRRIKN